MVKVKPTQTDRRTQFVLGSVTKNQFHMFMLYFHGIFQPNRLIFKAFIHLLRQKNEPVEKQFVQSVVTQTSLWRRNDTVDGYVSW